MSVMASVHTWCWSLFHAVLLWRNSYAVHMQGCDRICAQHCATTHFARVTAAYSESECKLRVANVDRELEILLE